MNKLNMQSKNKIEENIGISNNILKCETLERIIASKRMPVLFVGSGISKRYLNNYPSWEELLLLVSEKIGITKTSYAAIKRAFLNDNPNLEVCILYQKIATKLQVEFTKKIELEKIKLEDIFNEEEILKCINENLDFFKMLVAKLLKNYKLNNEMKEELNIFKSVNEKISMVFTTNFDEFLEKEIFRNFKVYDEQNKYYFRTSNGYGELFKIHGSIEKPNNIIITEKDYSLFDINLKLIASKLINALLDFPIIFLGYSFNDNNIRNIFENFVNSFDSKILNDIKKYIIIVEYDAKENSLIEGEKEFKGINRSINVSTIRTNNFISIYNYINRLTPVCSATELRRYKAQCARLIQETSFGNKGIFTKDIADANDEDMAIYIGFKEVVKNLEMSFSCISKHEMILCALNEELIDFDKAASSWYKTVAINSTQYTPVFYIKANLKKNYEDTCQNFKNNYTKKKDDFDQLLKRFSKYNFKTIEDIQKYILFNKNQTAINRYDKITNVLIDALIKGVITLDDYKKELKSLYNHYEKIVFLSPFKKAVCFIHYYVYEMKKGAEA